MTLPAPIYDLVLLLDPQAEPDARAKIVADTRASIEAQGELVNYDEWGERALAYPIDRHANAEYHLLQFHVGNVELLPELKRTLKITDGVLRFRVIKLKPGVPEAPDMAAAPPTRRPEAAAGDPAAEAPEAAPEQPAETDAEQPAAAEQPTETAAEQTVAEPA
jgi:small subunit ribosomal protein S6